MLYSELILLFILSVSSLYPQLFLNLIREFLIYFQNLLVVESSPEGHYLTPVLSVNFSQYLILEQHFP